jgi:uncharacterized repeat protein (TIGR01451 family)
MKIWIALAALFAPAAALAADNVSLSSEVFVERVMPGADGKPAIVREKPDVVVPGDKLVFQLSYRNGGAEPATGFTVTNPIPGAVSFTDGDEGTAQVSVDGGKSWGKLASLKIAQPDGTSRAAQPADVTHIRWSFSQPIPAASGGKLSFRGVVK